MEDFKVFRPGQVSTASSSSPGVVDEVFQGFFELFPKFKKSAEVTRQSSARVHGHSSSSTLSTDQVALAGLSDEFWEDEAGGVWMRLPNGRWCLLRSDPAVYWGDPG